MTALTHTYMFLPKRLYIYFLSFLFLISMKKKVNGKIFCNQGLYFLERKPHLNLQKFPGQLWKTMKLTLSASTFKASGLKGRLPSKQLHSAEKTKCTVLESQNWLRLERVQWGCRETLQCCRAKTSIVTEPSKNKPLPPATRTEKNPSPAPWLSLWINFIVLVCGEVSGYF